MKPVLYTLADRVATLTLNRPDSLNSLDRARLEALVEALARAVDEAAAVVVLTGAGRGFCSGADLGSALDGRDAEGRLDLGAPMRSHFNVLIEGLAGLPMPLVIAVNGIAAGGGASLALCGDIVIAARSAVFRQTFTDIGLMPDMGATWFMPRLAGRARARGMALLGQPIPAQTALDWGLIWEVVDDDRLAARAQELAVQLAARSPEALQSTRRALDLGLDNDLPAQLALEAEMQTELGRLPAFEQAVTAFLAKRRR